MKSLHWIALLALALGAPALADDKKKDDGFVPMFNEKDLSGWVNVNCDKSTFYVKDGEIITTGKPTGYLRTPKQYENFIAEFDWMHIPPKPGAVGNSGFFVWADPIPAVGTGYTRGIEVQVLVNLTYKNKKGEITATSQGDLFSIWGATCEPDRPHPDGWKRCLPNGDFAKGEREWNHYRVTANDGRIALEVNGHEVSGVSKCSPRKGYLALESEGSECHFKNLKIKELPSTNPKKDEIADEDQGFKSLYTGLDLSGWKADDEAKKHWQPHDTVLHYDGKGKALRTEKEFGDAQYVLDFRFPAKDAKPCTLYFPGNYAGGLKVYFDPSREYWSVERPNSKWGKDKGIPNGPKVGGQWNRLAVTVKEGKAAGQELTVTLNGKLLGRETGPALERPEKGSLVIDPEGEMDFANLFVRELK